MFTDARLVTQKAAAAGSDDTGVQANTRNHLPAVAKKHAHHAPNPLHDCWYSINS
jgi:hypothetical protein